jgi:hypothetical protein
MSQVRILSPLRNENGRQRQPAAVSSCEGPSGPAFELDADAVVVAKGIFATGAVTLRGFFASPDMVLWV